MVKGSNGAVGVVVVAANIAGSHKFNQNFHHLLLFAIVCEFGVAVTETEAVIETEIEIEGQ